jgi:predicted esterase
LSLFNELKRRNVFRVGIAYVVAVWVIAQVADLVLDNIGSPQWVMQSLLLLLAIGFVVAIIIAWAYELTPQGLKRDSGDNPSATRRSGGADRLSRLVTIVLALALTGIIGYWYSEKDARWASDQAYPAIELHAAEGNWEEAFAIAKDLESRLPDDVTLERLWETFSWLTSIPSRPSEATIYRRPYNDSDAEWELLGKTPLYNVRIPLGLSVLRMELEDHVPLLRVIGGETNGNQELPVQDRPFVLAPQIPPGGFNFDSPESLPEGMVRVPGELISLNGRQIEIRDFYIDRFEVSNSQFKEFIDSGAYQKQDLWAHEFLKNGEILSWDQAMVEFVDKTGRPGPSTWEAGSYPDGKEAHPVAGVSWYEAAAYARFKNRDLPTLHHWRRAFAEGMISWLLPASNLDATGTAPIGEFQGLGWSGTYDMAGNVREWCENLVGGERIILGGGWNDVPYVAHNSVSDPGSLPAFNRSSTNGIRLATTKDPLPVADALRDPIPVPVPDEAHDGELVSDAVFAAFLNNFKYDAGPFDTIIEETDSSINWDREHVSIISSDGRTRMSIYLYIPKKETARFKTIVYWPTDTALVLDSVDQLRMPLDFALKNGYVVALPVVDGTFERKQESYPNWASISGRNLVIRQIKDMRRSIDYLENRADINANALAYYGFSWGGRMGPIALVVEPRFKTGILNMAGLQHLTFPETSVLTYLPRVESPVLQFSGRYDSDFRFETSAKPFFELLGTALTDKKHVVEPTGHFVSRATVVRETLEWLDKYLGPSN